MKKLIYFISVGFFISCSACATVSESQNNDVVSVSYLNEIVERNRLWAADPDSTMKPDTTVLSGKILQTRIAFAPRSRYLNVSKVSTGVPEVSPSAETYLLKNSLNAFEEL